MGRMTVPVMDVVDVVAMGDHFVSAIRSVLVTFVVSVCHMWGRTFIPVTVVLVMNVTIVEIVDMVTVRHGSMATLGPVNVRMIGVNVTWHRALLPGLPF
jgi:hypothetical protein